MLDFLDKLRQQPLYIRRYIAIGTSTALSLLILSVWLGSWGIKNELTENSPPKTKSPIAVVYEKVIGASVQGGALLGNTKTYISQVAGTVASKVSTTESLYSAEDTVSTEVPIGTSTSTNE